MADRRQRCPGAIFMPTQRHQWLAASSAVYQNLGSVGAECGSRNLLRDGRPAGGNHRGAYTVLAVRSCWILGIRFCQSLIIKLLAHAAGMPSVALNFTHSGRRV